MHVAQGAERLCGVLEADMSFSSGSSQSHNSCKWACMPCCCFVACSCIQTHHVTDSCVDVRRAMPTPQARNMAITVRTIIVGLMYLATFIFSANALGLAGEHSRAVWLVCVLRLRAVLQIHACGAAV